MNFKISEQNDIKAAVIEDTETAIKDGQSVLYLVINIRHLNEMLPNNIK